MSVETKRHDTEAIPTRLLLKSYTNPYHAAELQWRLSVPLSALLLTLLAIPLSHVSPRQSRYTSLFPAILLYIIYVNLLFVARHWIEQQSIAISLGIWWVHALFIVIGSMMLYRQKLNRV